MAMEGGLAWRGLAAGAGVAARSELAAMIDQQRLPTRSPHWISNRPHL